MIFRKKKSGAGEDTGRTVLRGRDSLEKRARSSASHGDNPLARRFHPQDEPDTIDLEQPPRFGQDGGFPEADAATRDLGQEPDAEEHREYVPALGGQGLITFVAATGKFYLQPGEGEYTTRLNGQPVNAPTELRLGDRIRIGGSELLFQPAED